MWAWIKLKGHTGLTFYAKYAEIGYEFNPHPKVQSISVTFLNKRVLLGGFAVALNFSTLFNDFPTTILNS